MALSSESDTILRSLQLPPQPRFSLELAIFSVTLRSLSVPFLTGWKPFPSCYSTGQG